MTQSFKKHLSTSQSDISSVPYAEFLAGFKLVVKNAFHTQWDFDKFNHQRGLPTEVLRSIMDYKPLSVCIAKEYGGRGETSARSMALMSEASYESLALSLMLSINYALFIQPVLKYGQPDVKPSIFKRFLEQNHMGGLMITEPDFGSDALNMQTSFSEHADHFHLQGKKHWAGLTGMANYWLLTARGQANGKLKRDIDFFICDVSQPNQSIEVEEYFENLGLYMIPYGLNHINVRIPKAQRLVPHTSGVKMMLDTLHRSRLQFPGMGMGFIKRILDEAIAHTQQRSVGGKPLWDYGQVQHRLARLQANYTICSAMCVAGSEMAGIENDLTPHGLEANIIKCVTTDLMQESSQSLLQLVGAKGYKLNHVAGRATVDSRPFQIFEGANDILYIQISDALTKKMTAARETNLLRYLASDDLARLAAQRLGNQLNFAVTGQLPQRKQVELGILISRVFVLNLVLKMAERGYHADMAESAVVALLDDVATMASSYQKTNNLNMIEDYSEKSFWLDYVRG